MKNLQSLFSCFSAKRGQSSKAKKPGRKKSLADRKQEMDYTEVTQDIGEHNGVHTEQQTQRNELTKHKPAKAKNIKSIRYQPSIENEPDVMSRGDNCDISDQNTVNYSYPMNNQKSPATKSASYQGTSPKISSDFLPEATRRHSSVYAVTVNLSSDTEEDGHESIEETTPKVGETDEGLLTRLTKLLPWNYPAQRSLGEELSDRKAISQQNSTLSVFETSNENSTSSSPFLRPRSRTLDPSDTKQDMRRHSFSITKPKSSENQTRSSTNMTENEMHQERLRRAREKYRCVKTGAESSSQEKNKTLSKESNKNRSATHLRPTEERGIASEKTFRSFSHIDQLRQKLVERGEKVGFLDDNSESLNYASKNLSRSAQLLAEKYKNKKWYEL